MITKCQDDLGELPIEAHVGTHAHIGTRQHLNYLVKVSREYFMVGIVSKLSFVPASLGRMNVISKGDYDPLLETKKKRLLLIDEEDLNLDCTVTSHRAETLHLAQWLPGRRRHADV